MYTKAFDGYILFGVLVQKAFEWREKEFFSFVFGGIITQFLLSFFTHFNYLKLLIFKDIVCLKRKSSFNFPFFFIVAGKQNVILNVLVKGW